MAIAKFIDYIEKERNYSPHTIKAYAKDLDRFSEYCKDHHASNIDEIEYPLIRSWIVQLVEQGKTHRSINRKISVLRSYFNFLQRIDQRKTNPLRKHKPSKKAKKFNCHLQKKKLLNF